MTRLTQCTAFMSSNGNVSLNASTTLRRPVAARVTRAVVRSANGIDAAARAFVNFQQNVKGAFYCHRRRETCRTEQNSIVYTIWLVRSAKIICPYTHTYIYIHAWMSI